MRYPLMVIALLVCLVLAGFPAGAQAQVYGQPQGWHGVLSPSDQQDFDKDYAKWVNATRRQDQDDIASEAQKMESIMTRYNIPSGVSFDQVASNAAYTVAPNATYNVVPGQAYPAYAQARLSPDDQQKFDKEYTKWIDSQRKNDADDVAKHARNMQEIMARYNIPSTVPFQAIASGGGVAVVPNGAYAYPYSYPAGVQRLSADDQKNFDKAYRDWVKAEHKRDMDDVNKNVRRMQDIMARNNIPANVPFDAIASPGALNH